MFYLKSLFANNMNKYLRYLLQYLGWVAIMLIGRVLTTFITEDRVKFDGNTLIAAAIGALVALLLYNLMMRKKKTA